MDDRELLESAARAAGYKPHGWDEDINRLLVEDDQGPDRPWNPLRDDGDALRLAVQMELTIATGIRYCYVTGAHVRIEEPYDGDPVLGAITATSAMAATRRAIVRAAAAIATAKS